MIADVPWTEESGPAFGADWLLEAIAPAGAFGRRARARERAFRPGDEEGARRALARVVTAARAAEPARLEALRAALADAPDPGPALARAGGGGVLGDADFFELARFLDAHAAIAALAHGVVDEAVLREPAPELRATLAPGITALRTFYLDDGFDAALAAARAESARAQAAYDAARSRLAERAAAFAGVERVHDGEFVVMRERFSAPVPAEIRIVREAATYALCELALDDAALAALGARDAAVVAVAEAEEAVRARLSVAVAAAAVALERACDVLGDIDLLVARASFAQRYGCVEPEIVEAEIAFVDARYLPLALALERRGRRYAPISLELGGIGVVTGPNMGGKSASLRTIGFVAACVALGVPVPAASARVPLFDEIAWLGLAAAPADDGLLSAFGSEVVEARAFLQRGWSRALVLVDEFARTTAPREGRALLIALLETLRERGTLALAATHLTGVADAARAEHYAMGGLKRLPATAGAPLALDAALSRIAQAMDYRLVRVAEDAVPAADAIALAEALGLDAATIARARNALA